MTDTETTANRRAAVDAIPFWYHTLELGEGVTTPGWFDLRPIVDKMPWPEVRGKRCLDVGTYDGYLAFELERRGAAEVLALDIPNHEDWDWPAEARAKGGEELALLAGADKRRGFDTAHSLLGSSVEKVDLSAYEISPERLGTFDVVVCGSLMLHLRDPVRALEAIRTVCHGEFMSSEEVDLPLSLRHPRRPVARLDGDGTVLQWWIANRAAHRRMVHVAGFEVLKGTGVYSEPFGSGHPARRPGVRTAADYAMRRVITGHAGVPHAALLARPRL